MKKAYTFFIYFLGAQIATGQPNTHLQVQGRNLIGTCGDNIVLRGINYPVFNWGYDLSENYFTELAKTNANAIRLVWYKNSGQPIYNNLVNLDTALARCVRSKMIPIVDLHDATCTSDMAQVAALVSFYTSAGFKALEIKYRKHLIINIANEAGVYYWAGNPATALSDYRSTYQNIIISLRNEGLQIPFMVDAPDCGTNSDAIVSAGQQILNSDVLGNTMFSVHGYWYGFANNDSATMATKIQALVNTGLTIVFGEIANEQDDAAPCMYLLQYVPLLKIAKANNIGWMAWCWYHDICNNRQISNNGSSNNLTAYGQVIVNDAAVGLKFTAIPPIQLNSGCSVLSIHTSLPGVINPRNKEIKIFPNPAADVLHITVPARYGRYTLSLFNAIDQQKILTTLTDVTQLPINQLPSGMYLLQIDLTNTEPVQRFFYKL